MRQFGIDSTGHDLIDPLFRNVHDLSDIFPSGKAHFRNVRTGGDELSEARLFFHDLCIGYDIGTGRNALRHIVEDFFSLVFVINIASRDRLQDCDKVHRLIFQRHKADGFIDPAVFFGVKMFGFQKPHHFVDTARVQQQCAKHRRFRFEGMRHLFEFVKFHRLIAPRRLP